MDEQTRAFLEKRKATLDKALHDYIKQAEVQIATIRGQLAEVCQLLEWTPEEEPAVTETEFLHEPITD